MKLYYKFILSYIIFGVAAFAVIATLSALLTHRYLIQSQSQTLYDEANLIASSYSGDYDEDAVNLETIEPQIRAIGTSRCQIICCMFVESQKLRDSS